MDLISDSDVEIEQYRLRELLVPIFGVKSFKIKFGKILLSGIPFVISSCSPEKSNNDNDDEGGKGDTSVKKKSNTGGGKSNPSVKPEEDPEEQEELEFAAFFGGLFGGTKVVEENTEFQSFEEFQKEILLAFSPQNIEKIKQEISRIPADKKEEIESKVRFVGRALYKLWDPSLIGEIEGIIDTPEFVGVLKIVEKIDNPQKVQSGIKEIFSFSKKNSAVNSTVIRSFTHFSFENLPQVLQEVSAVLTNGDTLKDLYGVVSKVKDKDLGKALLVLPFVSTKIFDTFTPFVDESFLSEFKKVVPNERSFSANYLIPFAFAFHMLPGEGFSQMLKEIVSEKEKIKRLGAGKSYGGYSVEVLEDVNSLQQIFESLSSDQVKLAFGEDFPMLRNVVKGQAMMMSTQQCFFTLKDGQGKVVGEFSCEPKGEKLKIHFHPFYKFWESDKENSKKMFIKFFSSFTSSYPKGKWEYECESLKPFMDEVESEVNRNLGN